MERAGFMRYIHKDIVIGIDPDITASGVAVLDVKTEQIQLMNLNFTDMVRFLQNLTHIYIHSKNITIQIIIEYSAGTKHNWHLSRQGENKFQASAKGYSLGQNHQIEQCIYDYAKDYLKLDIIRQSPFKKCWKGKDRKISHQELASIMPIKDRVTNQEKRDAALLAWLGANKPIKVSV